MCENPNICTCFGPGTAAVAEDGTCIENGAAICVSCDNGVDPVDGKCEFFVNFL